MPFYNKSEELTTYCLKQQERERERERERESGLSEKISLHGREWVSQKMGETKFLIFLQIELREKDRGS